MQDQQNNTDLPPIHPAQEQGLASDALPAFPNLPTQASPTSSPQAVQPQTVVPLPDEAADTDLIEKEWVVKAKQIVEHTSSDPYTQQEELNKVKADYMKKRYNKDIKLTGK